MRRSDEDTQQNHPLTLTKRTSGTGEGRIWKEYGHSSPQAERVADRPEGVELLEIEGMGDVGFTTALIAPQSPTLITRQVWDSLLWEETSARVE